jgi:hypothetical protein
MTIAAPTSLSGVGPLSAIADYIAEQQYSTSTDNIRKPIENFCYLLRLVEQPRQE